MLRPDGSPVRVITQSESLHDQSHRVDQVTAAKPPHGCLRGQGTAQDSPKDHCQRTPGPRYRGGPGQSPTGRRGSLGRVTALNKGAVNSAGNAAGARPDSGEGGGGHRAQTANHEKDHTAPYSPLTSLPGSLHGVPVQSSRDPVSVTAVVTWPGLQGRRQPGDPGRRLRTDPRET